MEAIDIGPDETAGDVEARLAPLGARLALAVVDRLAAGEDAARHAAGQQPGDEGAEAEEGRRRHRLVAARRSRCAARSGPCTPGRRPTRTGTARGRSRCASSSTAPCRAPPTGRRSRPARSCLPARSALAVGAGGGTVVEILELQPAGKKRMPAADFLRGRRPQPGDRLGRITTHDRTTTVLGPAHTTLAAWPCRCCSTAPAARASSRRCSTGTWLADRARGLSAGRPPAGDAPGLRRAAPPRHAAGPAGAAGQPAARSGRAVAARCSVPRRRISWRC